MNRGTSNRRTYFAYLAVAGLAVTVTACGGTVQSAPEAPGPNGIQSTTGQPAGGAGTQVPQEVAIVTHDSMRFEPATLTVEAGRPVRLTVRNQGQAVHDLSLTKGVARSVKVVVKGGQSAATTFTVARPGTYQFTCSQFGHAMSGMRGTITVTAPGDAGVAGKSDR